MAPAKQSVLSLSTFFKNPKLKTVKKHKQLERKAAGLPATQGPKKPKIDKKKEEERKREEAVAVGSEQWRRYLHKSGDPDADTIRTDMLFHTFGPAPPYRRTDRSVNDEISTDDDIDSNQNHSDLE